MKDGEVENGTAPRKTGGSNPRESNGGQSSVDAWERAKPKGKCELKSVSTTECSTK